ncbi:MAG: PorT family protein [Bacteroidales bacterium]|nr:PorT family protein [Bacteroidales bacterium]
MMKRAIILTLLFIPSICWAQTYIGIKSGYSLFSSISFKPDLKATAFPGKKPDFGLILKYYDNKWAGFQGEINFTQRGYIVPFKDTAKLQHVSNYVEIPIFFQVHSDIAGLYFHINLGCYAAYLLSAKQGVDTTGKMVLQNYDLNILRDNRFDYGLIGGAGISYEFGWGVIQVDARMSYGYTDLYDYRYTGMPEKSNALVQNISISYMYNFSKLGKKKKHPEFQ